MTASGGYSKTAVMSLRCGSGELISYILFKIYPLIS